FRCDVAKTSVPQVFKEHIAASHGGDEQIRITIIIDVCEARRYTDPVFQPHASLLRDILEAPIAEVAPELVPAQLRHEINVLPPISIHIRHCKYALVIVMHRFVMLVRILHCMVRESNAALLDPIRKLERPEDL